MLDCKFCEGPYLSFYSCRASNQQVSDKEQALQIFVEGKEGGREVTGREKKRDGGREDGKDHL